VTHRGPCQPQPCWDSVTLVIQYTVKYEQKIDYGGGYVKIFPSNLDQKNLSGDSQHYIMFGEFIVVYSYYSTVASAVVEMVEKK